jgi:hypothetical protein
MVRNISSVTKEEREEMKREARLCLGYDPLGIRPALPYQSPFSKMRRLTELYPKHSSMGRTGGEFVILPNTIKPTLDGSNPQLQPTP